MVKDSTSAFFLLAGSWRNQTETSAPIAWLYTENTPYGLLTKIMLSGETKNYR